MSGDDSWNDYTWNELLQSIERREVIPIVGGGLVTVPSTGEPFTKWLGRKLAESLNVNVSGLVPPVDVNQVVGVYFRSIHNAHTGKMHSFIRSIIEENIKKKTFEPLPQPLTDLARITHFKVFLTTTYDGMLQAALDKERYGGNSDTPTLDLWPQSRRKDLDEDWETQKTTLVYLLGSYPKSPDFAAWDADIIDYVLELYVALKEEALTRLRVALREKKLLLLGMSFGDWLTRFFIHLARRSPWCGDNNEAYIAEHERFESLEFFVQGTRRGACFIPGDPATFVSELYGRWTEKFGISQRLEGNTQGSSDIEEDPKGKVFLSYAREDREAAKTLCDCLRKAGCDVWFDETELVSGEAYRNTMEQAIRVDCCAFISIISRYTEANAGFFHQERGWAIVRSAYEGALGDFYLPVIVDPGVNFQQIKREPLPTLFRPNFVMLARGEADRKFCDRLIDLQKKYRERRRNK